MLGIGLLIGLVCGGTISGICVHLYHTRPRPEEHHDERTPEEIAEHQEAMSEPVTMAPEHPPVERIGVRTAVTRIMEKRGYQNHEEAEVVNIKDRAKHRLDTTAIKTIHKD